MCLLISHIVDFLSVVVVIDMVIMDLNTSRFDLHRHKVLTFSEVTNEKPMLSCMTDLSLKLNRLMRWQNIVVLNEILDVNGLNILGCFGN